MKKTLALLAFVFVLTTVHEARAHDLTLWPMGQHFCGSTEQLYKIRAAVTKLFCAQSLAHGLAGCPPTNYYEAPFETNRSIALLPPLGIDPDVDCMQSLTMGPGTAWNDGNDMYLGQTTTVDVDPTEGVQMEEVYIPSAEELYDFEDLPPNVLDYYQIFECGSDPQWYADMCSWSGYCCPLN